MTMMKPRRKTLLDEEITGDILVVDDRPENLAMLSNLLTAQGHKVRKVLTGQLALTAAKIAPPDLMLLDVNMPHMNGYQVCQALKKDEKTFDIPVIFISAMDSLTDKIKAFEAGGIDYITKPFQAQEVIARIKNHLLLRVLNRRIAQQSDELQEKNKRLEVEIRERRQAEEQYRQIFENSAEGMYQTSQEGKLLKVNPALARILGYRSMDDLMDSVTDVSCQLYVQAMRRAEFVAYLRQYDVVDDFESEVYRKDGSRIWIAENAKAVRDLLGQLLHYEGTIREVTSRRRTEQELHYQRQNSERLLLNILPSNVANRLKKGESAIADYFPEATVMFADIVGFTKLATHLPPKELVKLLNQIFAAFDRLCDRNRLEKVKTIGDSYMVVGGMPKPRPDHVEVVVKMAIEMQREMRLIKLPPDLWNRLIQEGWDDKSPLALKIGIHTGPVIAGVIGSKRFGYDLLGETVNLASRMENRGEPRKIHVTKAVYTQLKDTYEFESRKTHIREVGEIITYWLLGKKR